MCAELLVLTFCESIKDYVQSRILRPDEEIGNMRAVLEAECSLGGRLQLELGAPDSAIEIDGNHFKRLILELTGNAIKAVAGMAEGWIRITTRPAHLSAEEIARMDVHDDMLPGNYMMLTVEDNGSGMDETVRQQMFEPFYTTVPRDAGLGLAVVRGLVRDMHGGIAVESRADKGSYITICLPTVERDQTADESEN